MQLCFNAYKLIYDFFYSFVLIFVLKRILNFGALPACDLKPSTKSQRALAGDLSSVSTERQLSKATKTIPRALFSQEEVLWAVQVPKISKEWGALKVEFHWQQQQSKQTILSIYHR